MAELSPNAQGIRWEFSFDSSEFERQRAFQGLVRIHEDGEVSFLSAGTTVRRAIERVVLSDAFVFLCIQEGKRFVFVPRTMVASDEAAAIAEFVSRRIAARS